MLYKWVQLMQAAMRMGRPPCPCQKGGPPAPKGCVICVSSARPPLPVIHTAVCVAIVDCHQC